jgi:hypothetical protein
MPAAFVLSITLHPKRLASTTNARSKRPQYELVLPVPKAGSEETCAESTGPGRRRCPSLSSATLIALTVAVVFIVSEFGIEAVVDVSVLYVCVNCGLALLVLRHLVGRIAHEEGQVHLSGLRFRFQVEDLELRVRGER